MLHSNVPDIVRDLTSWGNNVVIQETFGNPDEAIEWCKNLNDEVEKVSEDWRHIEFHAVSPNKNYKVLLIAYVDKRSFEYEFMYLKNKKGDD